MFLGTSALFLFLGASLEGIEDYLEGIRFRTSPNRQHYAWVAVTDVPSSGVSSSPFVPVAPSPL